MRAFIARYRMRVVAVVAAFSVAATACVWWAADGFGERVDGADCSVPAAGSAADAAAIAAACGIEVEVLDERTPWHRVWSTAEGATRLEASAMPTEVEVDGRWVELDRTFVEPEVASSAPQARSASAPGGVVAMSSTVLPDSEELLVVAAPVFPIGVNPGGPAGENLPLARIEKDGHFIELGAPFSLPFAEVDGHRVRYDLGSGVVLYVSVNTDSSGVLPVFELQSPAALEHLRSIIDSGENGEQSDALTLRFPLTFSEGLQVAETGDSFELLDADGEVQYVAATPYMWDSRGGVVGGDSVSVDGIDRTAGFADGDAVAAVRMDVVDSKIILTADAGFLNSPETVWPVYIDPSITGKTPAEWVAVRTGGFTSTMYKWGDISSTMLGQGTGYCSDVASCNTVFTQRLSWEFSGLSTIASLASSDVLSATFRVYGADSGYCPAAAVSLRGSSNLSTSSTWSNLSWGTTSHTVTQGFRSSCGGAGTKAYTATSLIRAIATNNQSTVSMGMRVSESTMTHWKRFRSNATLEIVYNRAPLTPIGLQISDPATAGCFRAGDPGLPPAINETRPTLQATFADPDGQAMKPSFQVAAADNLTTPLWREDDRSTTVATNTATTARVDNALITGNTYAWRAQALDTQAPTGRRSPWSDWCLFRVDTSKPVMPTVTPVRSDVPAIYEQGRTRGGVGLAGAFIVGPGSSTDVTGFRYSFNDPVLPADPVPVDASGSLRIEFPAPLATAMTHILRVQSVDDAGNSSNVREFIFTIDSPSEDAVWTLDEGEGTIAAQKMGTDVNPLRINGATWAEGPHGLFDSRDGDTSLVFDGVDDSATSENTVLDTTGSYVVSAHVVLDPTATSDGAAVVLGQDAVSKSAFRLQYVAPCPTGGDGCWAFSVESETDGQPALTVYSPAPAVKGEWTHLLASYNASSTPTDPRTLQLWTCTIGTPTDPDPATPVGVELEVPASFTPMSSTGGFSIGRGRIASASADWWKGQIDNIRVFTGEIVDPPKIRRMCQGAEATDFSAGEVALDPTVTVSGQ